MTEHKQGCDALGGYGHGIGPCSCGAQPAQAVPITSESGKQAAQGASAITSGSVPQHPRLTADGVAEQWTAQAVPLLSDEEIEALVEWEGDPNDPHYNRVAHGRAIEQAVRAKLGVAVPMTDPQLVTAIKAAGFKTWDSRMWSLKRQIEAHHGIVGKEGA